MSPHPFGDEKSVEAKSEGDDEHHEDDDESEEGLEHVEEHDHVDAEEGQLPDVAQKVQPRQHDRHRAQLPLPTLRGKKCFMFGCCNFKLGFFYGVHLSISCCGASLPEVEHDDEGQDEDDPVEQIRPLEIPSAGLKVPKKDDTMPL